MQYVATPYRGGEGYSFTLIVDASSEQASALLLPLALDADPQPPTQGAVISENVFGLQSKFMKESFGNRPWFDVPEDLLEEDVVRILPLGTPPHEPFARPAFFSASKPGDSWASALGEWVDARARERGAMARYAALQAARGQAVDLDDLRVRDVAEAPAFAEYLQQVKIVYSWRDTLEVRLPLGYLDACGAADALRAAATGADRRADEEHEHEGDGHGGRPHGRAGRGVLDGGAHQDDGGHARAVRGRARGEEAGLAEGVGGAATRGGPGRLRRRIDDAYGSETLALLATTYVTYAMARVRRGSVLGAECFPRAGLKHG